MARRTPSTTLPFNDSLAPYLYCGADPVHPTFVPQPSRNPVPIVDKRETHEDGASGYVGSRDGMNR